MQFVICNQQPLEHIQKNLTSSNCWSQCIKSHCNIFRVTVHSVTKLLKFIIKTPCITFDRLLYIKPFEISKYLQMVFVIRLSGFQLLMSFFGNNGSVMEGLGLKGSLEIIYAPAGNINRTFFTRVSDFGVSFIKYYAGRFYHCKLSNWRSKQWMKWINQKMKQKIEW